MGEHEVLRRAAELAIDYLDGLPERPVRAQADLETLESTLGGELPEDGQRPVEVIEHLVRGADPGIVGSAGPRFFGFVIGGSYPVAVAADWLTSAWDQNPGLYATSPALSVVEDVTAKWLLELFGLPEKSGVGFVTGGQMANFTGLAAARHAVLRRAGWDVEEDGLFGAPEVEVVIGDEAHVTILAALRFLGMGRSRVTRIPTDEHGRMRPDALGELLAESDVPTVVCAQAGNVNTGAFDPFDEIADVVAARRPNAWLHVDAAFGLWAAASRELRGLLRGVERADSWGTDAHKWLNVPYDSGIAIVRDPVAHRAAMGNTAAYLIAAVGRERDPSDWVPEFSRRARGFPVYAALRSLGRSGVGELVERCCRLARRMADRLGTEPGVRILNDVVLNQVLVRFAPPGDDDPAAADALTRETIARVQADGTCWLGGTTWHGMAAMRISVSNWSTTEEDAERSVEAILRCAREATAGRRPELAAR